MEIAHTVVTLFVVHGTISAAYTFGILVGLAMFGLLLLVVAAWHRYVVVPVMRWLILKVVKVWDAVVASVQPETVSVNFYADRIEVNKN